MQNPSSHPPPPPNLALPPGLAPPPGLSSLPPPAGPPPGIAPAAPPLEQASKDEKNSNSLVTIVKAQIVFLLSSINEDSFSSRVNDIRQLSDHHGPEIYHYFLRRLVNANAATLNASSNGPVPSGGNMVWRLMVLEGKRVARDVLLGSQFAQAIAKAEPSELFRTFSFTHFANRVSLSPSERLTLGAGLLTPGAVGVLSRILDQGRQLVQENFQASMDSLRAGQGGWFDEETDLSPGMGTLLLSTLLSTATVPLLDGEQRRTLLMAMTAKFSAGFLGSTINSLPLPLSGVSLPEFLCELGQGTADVQALRTLLGRWWGGVDGLQEKGRSLIVGLAEVLAQGELGGVDAGAVVRALISLQDADNQIDWASIIGSFGITPHPHILLVPAVLPLLLSLLALPPQTPSAPISAFFAPGSSYYSSHPLIVLQITELLLSLPQETFSLAIIPGLDKVVTPDDVPDVSPAWVGSGWNIKAVYDLMRRASEHQEERIRERSQEILEGGMQTRLELIFLGLVQTAKPYSPVHAAILSRLLDMFFAHHTQNAVLFTRLWQTEPDVLREYFSRVYEASEMNLQGIVDIAEMVGAFGSLLSRKPFAFALDVAALAAKSETVNLEQYLEDSISANDDEFLGPMLDFLGHKINSELVRQEADADATTIALSAPVVGTFLRVLTQSALSDSQKATLADLRLRALQLYPRLLNLVPGSDAEHGFEVVAFSEETESEVDGIYRRMYDDADSVPVETVVTYLAAWRESADSQRQRIFACMLYTLLDEHKFFHTYPPRQLALTGQLFGALIFRHLIEGLPLTVSLRYVTESLRSPADAPASSFDFGFIALQAFQSRLAEFPDVCDAVVAIPHLHESHPHLIEFVRTTLADRDAERAKGHIGADGQVIVPIFKALRLDTFDTTEPVEEPDEDTSDRILFIVNNLAPSNFEAKVDDMKEAFQARHSRWFAHYFIGSRVSVEPNNHALYMQFIEALDRDAFERHVLYETYSKTYTLLNSEKTVSQAQDRATLKNLGSWLGRLTLARDLPLKFNQLSLKDLLVEGYDAKRLIVAIPFVCKVLEQCARSKVFHPPNPWLMAVLRLLVELYHTAELKLNLKFEIEVLCKTLGLDLAKITPTTFIRDRPTELPGGVQSLTQDLERLSMAGGFVGAEPGRSAVSVYQTEAAAAAAQAALNRKVDELIADLPAYLVFPPETIPFNSNATLKRIVFTAIERAIREIVVPVVERSVTIAGISSRDLITKDFATEGDESKMRKAAHAMVQNLAGNLAMVTSKDPLRSSISTSVRALLQQNGFNEATIPGDSVVAVVGANLDLAASVIKRAAQDKAIYDVDETLSAAFQLRQRHRESGGNQAFWDGTQPVVNINILPDMLRVRPNGLLPQQMEVYEEFAKQKSPRSRPGVLNGADGKLQRPGVIDRLRGLPLGYRTPSPASEAMLESAAAAPTSLSNDQSLLKFQQIISEVDKYISQSGVASLATLPQHHDLKMAIRQIPVIAAQSYNRDETALGFSQKVVQLLYKTDSALGREVFVLVLQRLCELFPKVQKEVVNWLIYAEDERKFNVPVTVALVRAGLISMVEQDVQLAHFVLRDLRPAAINFTASFVRECLLSEQPCATRAQLSNSLEALARAAQVGKVSDSVIRLLEDIAGGAQAPGQQQAVESEVALRDRLAFYFLEWVRLFQQAPSAEQAFVSIVTNLQAQGILKGDEVTFLFFRVCAEVAVEGYAKLKVADPVAALIPMDALSKIFILLLKNYGDPNGAEVDESKIRYLNKILSIVVLVLVRSHEELGAEFDQRPFFRFFSSILNDLHSIEPSIRTAYAGCLRAFSSNTLSMLQPTLLPGFTFSWMSLISHRLFMPKLLASNKDKNWPEYHSLLIALFKFLGPFLSSPKLQDSSRALYKGTMRILLVLLHDFPDFLAEFYLSLVEALPPHCTQIRNVVLSAFPRNTTLPDPVAYDFALADAHKLLVPTVASDYVSILGAGMDEGFDHIAYMSEMLDVHVPEAVKKIAGTGSDGQVRYNLPFLNAAVLSLGVHAVDYLMLSPGGVKTDWTFEAQRPSVVAFERIAAQLDNEGQYHLMSSIVNNLRHPSAHTHWFAHLLLHLFGTTTGSAVAGGPAAPLAEIIARVLLERVVVARPHPWGVLVTFIQMLRLPGFWNQDFVRRSRELEAMFKTCAS